MLLKFSASYADLHLFTPNSAPLPHPEAVTLSFISLECLITELEAVSELTGVRKAYNYLVNF